MLKILWKRGEIAPEEQCFLLSTIFCYLMLDFYVKTRIRVSLRDKRLFEITEVEITRVDCISISKSTVDNPYAFTFGFIYHIMLLPHNSIYNKYHASQDNANNPYSFTVSFIYHMMPLIMCMHFQLKFIYSEPSL